VTVNWHVAVPLQFMAVQVTVVVPTGNGVPDDGEQKMVEGHAPGNSVGSE
jgi:hypothetical protein